MHLYADSTVIVDLQALIQNYQTLCKHAKGVQCAAVVKADAYGLGIESVSKALSQAGCNHFFVAHLNEAVELRQYLPDAGIYVFHGLLSGQEEVFKAYNIVPIINGIRQLVLWQQAATHQPLPTVLHIDTGMNRLGMGIDDIKTLMEEGGNPFPHLDVRLVMSHLASASSPRSKVNKEQLALAKQVKSYFSDVPMSLAASAAIYLGKEYHFDLVRPGCALYGVTPLAKMKDIKPVVTLISKIIQFRNVTEGNGVGYGCDFVTKRPSVIATIPVGYADGYARCIGNKKNNSYVTIQGHKAPIVGRISMDTITLDVTDVPSEHIYLGSEVELIGQYVTVNDVAKWAGTIGYEVLTLLGRRYKRVYR